MRRTYYPLIHRSIATCGIAILLASLIPVIGQETGDATVLDGSRSLRSISTTGTNAYQTSSDHGYKIILKDDSTTILDPATVSLPVQLEGSKALLPLGAVIAMKFRIQEGEEIPDSIFVRLRTGHIYQLPWAERKRTFSCESVSGNTLTIAYADILGILPIISEGTSQLGQPPDQRFRLDYEDNTFETVSAPLQIWTFKTAFGRIALPSPLVSSFSIPQKWFGTGRIETIYGESFEGKPTFKSIFYSHHGHTETIPLKSLLAVTLSPLRAHLALPSAACIVYLADGSAVAGIPYALDKMIRSIDDETIVPDKNSSISRTKSDYHMYAASRGATVLAKPVDRKLDICLTASGQKVSIDWDQIDKIEFNRPMHPYTPPEDTTVNDSPAEKRQSIPPVSTRRKPTPGKHIKTPGRIDEDTEREVNDRDEGSTMPSVFGWLRNQISGETNAISDTALELGMPWGRIELEPERIRAIYLRADQSTDVIITTRDDVILAETDDLRKAKLAETMPERVFTNQSTLTFALPPYVQHRDNPVRIRMMRGDIISGTFIDDNIPFKATEKTDTRTGVPTSMLKRIIRKGNDTLRYETQRGNIIGKAIRDKVAFKLAATPGEIEIAIRDIETIMVGSGPLPPPITHTADRPPALCGLIYLPGGSFVQGSGETGMTDETPTIPVTLSAFFLDATEITRAQFTAFVEDSGYETTAEQTGAATTWMNPGFLQQPDDPVVCVSWLDATEFCNWRSRQASLQPVYEINRDGSITTDRTANGYRLPTESEWEYAAGGIRKTTYPWGNTLSVSSSTPPANFMPRGDQQDDGWRWTNPVNAFPPDPNGIYGMAGNVWEWCEDWYFNRAYDALKNRSPLNPCIQQTDVTGLTHRVMRGGSYRNPADLLRSASRGSGLPQAFAPHVGFRCARNAN